MRNSIISLLIALLASSWSSVSPCAENISPASADKGRRGSTEQVPAGLSVSDWSSIRTAYEAGRHAAVQEADGTVGARNPGQRWRTCFDGRGFTVTPDAGGWSWGLELQSYGFAGEEHSVGPTASVDHEKGEVRYERDRVLREWFVNDRRGLQQGWTLSERPMGGGQGGPLRLAFALRGGLMPAVASDGTAVSFTDAAGTRVLDFSGLRAWDADDRPLAARFEARGGDSLHVVVQESGARYPITIDPIAQQAYLKASNTAANDFFGYSVAVSGDTAVVGACYEDSNATGVNGNQSDNSLSQSGAAYVFVREGTNWSQQAYLKASNTGSGDRFGASVAVSGDTIVVGAYYEDSNAAGVNGDESNNSATDSGAAYVFVRSGTTWSQQAYLKASNTGAEDYFGQTVAVSGDTVVVGAEYEASVATGINGDGANNDGFACGAAYVFVRSGTSWSQQAYLKASNTGLGDFFGHSVAVSGDTVVVGAYGEASAAVGVNGNQSDNSASASGAAYVFMRSGTVWSQQAYLKASNTGANDLFGTSAGASGGTIVVGAYGEDSAATGVNGDQSDNSASISGAAYVFTREGTNWSQQAYLKASNTAANDYFGYSAALSGDTAVVGAYSQDGTWIDSGAAYVFARSGTNWSQQACLKASNVQSGDTFGWSVAVSGDTILVGAHGEDSNATGVNGNQSDNSMAGAGAAYVFLLPSDPEIVVEQPVGTDVSDGGERSFGTVPPGGATNLTFTIRNIGAGSLTGLTITKDGDNAADFTVTDGPVAPVEPGSNTTFTVQFAPTSTGEKIAAIHIANNDVDENPFDITLGGTGLTALENWRLLYFGTTQNSGDAADMADPECDGAENLKEFGFGLNPLLSDSFRLPQPTRVGSDLVITFMEPSGVSGITYGAETSTDLLRWDPVTDSGSGTTHTFSVPVGPEPERFLRLIVTSP